MAIDHRVNILESMVQGLCPVSFARLSAASIFYCLYFYSVFFVFVLIDILFLLFLNHRYFFDKPFFCYIFVKFLFVP